VTLYRIANFIEYSAYSFQNIMKANDHLGSKMTEEKKYHCKGIMKVNPAPSEAIQALY